MVGVSAPRHRKCPRHDLHDRDAACDPYCLNPARYFEALAEANPDFPNEEAT